MIGKREAEVRNTLKNVVDDPFDVAGNNMALLAEISLSLARICDLLEDINTPDEVEAPKGDIQWQNIM